MSSQPCQLPMKTGCFFTCDGPGRISIARFAPCDIPRGYRVFKRLAPRRWFNGASKDEFEEQFTHYLCTLDPLKVWTELHELADTEPVLLCWERSPLDHTNWCHRRWVARWFHETLGKDVAEL
jgi:hypothetical protein